MPETFWQSTFYELSCAYIGYLQDKGVLDEGYRWSDEDLDALDALERQHGGGSDLFKSMGGGHGGRDGTR